MTLHCAWSRWDPAAPGVTIRMWITAQKQGVSVLKTPLMIWCKMPILNSTQLK